MCHLYYNANVTIIISDSQQKICSVKSHEKIWWYYKNFINEKIKIKSVRFVSNKTLPIKINSVVSDEL